MYYFKYLDKFRAILCSFSGVQNSISTASGIITVCERPCSAPVAVKIQFRPPEDEHSITRNMSRYLMKYIY
jgi:hypothetical protein